MWKYNVNYFYGTWEIMYLNEIYINDDALLTRFTFVTIAEIKLKLSQEIYDLSIIGQSITRYMCCLFRHRIE